MDNFVHARMKDENLEKYIYQMEPGDRGYIVPWALATDASKYVYVRPHHTVHPDRLGTVSVPIEMADGYAIVDKRTIPAGSEYGVENCEGMIPVMWSK